MSFPGPEELGRGLVVAPGATVPPPFATAPRFRLDDEVLSRPAELGAVLHSAWNQRRRVVIELAIPPGDLRAPEIETRPPYELGPAFTFERERLHFFVWANNYDARGAGRGRRHGPPGDDPGETRSPGVGLPGSPGAPVWWHAVRAARLGAGMGGPADVLGPDGSPLWCDGGPRRPVHPAASSGPGRPAVDGTGSVGAGAAGAGAVGAGAVGAGIVHRHSIDAGLLTVSLDGAPQAELAPDQLVAVTHPGGPARIIAPAGSGKTRVLTERIRHLLCDRGYEARLVTAVAYNVLAADELRARTAGFTPTIRTLNSLGLSVCAKRPPPAGSWRVAEERECRDILAGLVRPTRRVGSDPIAPYLDALSAIRLGLLRPAEAESAHPDAVGVAAVLPAYLAALERAGALDFDEQVHRAVSLLLADPELRAEVRTGHRSLLVDEFQDLTPAHILLLRLVAGPPSDVFGVGDDDQVIYGYAGADPGFLIDFARYFPGAAEYQLRVNYRCPPAVVTGARKLLAHNRRRVDKEIRSGRTGSVPAPPPEGAAGGAPAVGDAAPAGEPGSGLTERHGPAHQLGAETVATVRSWAAAGVPWRDMAVLTRVNSSLLPVQILLGEAGIPARAAVGAAILDRAGTAAALAYLRIAVAPERIGRADIRATVRRPSRRISPKAIEMLGRDALTSLRSVRGLAGWMAERDAFARDAERLSGYADDLAALGAAAAGGADTAELLRLARDGIGLGEAMDVLDSSKGVLDRSSNGDDLAALLQVAPLHPDPSTFEEWLRAALRRSSGAGPGPRSGRGGGTGADEGVHLATVHRVKGREWLRVAVFGADAGLFPHRLAADVEEERRIFHVAITRARDEVVVIADEKSPSPFLDELTHDVPLSAAGPGTTASPVGPAGRNRGASPRQTAPGARPKSPPPAREPEATPATATAAAALRAWRTARAQAERKPAFVFLSDAHIADIARRDPATRRDLAGCRGIGPMKLDAYGDEILAVLEEARRSGSVPEPGS